MQWRISQRGCANLLLPPANVVCAKVMFSQASVILLTGGACMVLFGGACVVLFAGVYVVLFGGACVVLSGGCAWFNLGGCAWFNPGGMHGFIRGVRGFIWGGIVIFSGSVSTFPNNHMINVFTLVRASQNESPNSRYPRNPYYSWAVLYKGYSLSPGLTRVTPPFGNASPSERLSFNIDVRP